MLKVDIKTKMEDEKVALESTQSEAATERSNENMEETSAIELKQESNVVAQTKQKKGEKKTGPTVKRRRQTRATKYKQFSELVWN